MGLKFYRVVRVSRQDGKEEDSRIEKARKNLEPHFYTPGTIDELIEKGKDFSLQNFSYIYRFYRAK